MPLTIPNLDNRTYQELLDEALARIPVHNPEWTNFNRSDPGVTLVELFAFLTENLLYRSNQIPERNRRKFLSLLGVPLQAAQAARGLVAFANERGPLQAITLNADLEVRAAQVPFRTTGGLDVLPIEAQAFYKRSRTDVDGQLTAYYQQLYASFVGQHNLGAKKLQLYEMVPFPQRGSDGVDLGAEAVDASLWVALLARPRESVEDARAAIAGKTLSLGIVPKLVDASRHLAPGRPNAPENQQLLTYKLPKIPASGGLSTDIQARAPEYRPLDPRTNVDVLAEPGVVELTLPGADELTLWNNIDPLEAGVGDLPPVIDDTNLADRVITWLRISSKAAVQARLLWVGINAVFVSQRAEVANELLPNGTGEPDQAFTLSHASVLPESVQITITQGLTSTPWHEIDDLSAAGPEVPAPDPRLPPGAPQQVNTQVHVFAVDAEAGQVRFGNGTRGARPPFGATIRANYAYSLGAAGNVGAGSISSGPALPAGLKVSNPVATWGGAAAETVAQGEKQIARYLQHRDRLVNASDFETIALRTPGVDIGRVEVLPAFNPALSPNEPGDAPGAVTLMLIPRYDPAQPDAPRPDQLFLDQVCAYLDPRRLVTTEVFLRGPAYKPIWISIGIDVVAGVSVAPVREAVKQAILAFLSPLPATPEAPLDAQALLSAPQYAATQRGWPLRKAVVELELLAVASRVPGVLLVNKVILAEGSKPAAGQVAMNGLELPQVLGISVVAGDPQTLDELRGQGGPPLSNQTDVFLPVPLIPEECR
jgi:hypothetical protein